MNLNRWYLYTALFFEIKIRASKSSERERPDKTHESGAQRDTDLRHRSDSCQDPHDRVAQNIQGNLYAQNKFQYKKAISLENSVRSSETEIASGKHTGFSC